MVLLNFKAKAKKKPKSLDLNSYDHLERIFQPLSKCYILPT